MSARKRSQFDLFGSTPGEFPPAQGRVLPATVDPESQSLREQLPMSLYLGTSSWAFPGWAGTVYREPYPSSVLSREGLRAYAQHPLLRTVGVDRTFYAPIGASAFAAYADMVPADFRFLVKAHAALTTPKGMRVSGHSPGSDHFLDAEYAARHVIEPTMQGLGDKLGILLFQFPPMSLSRTRLEALPSQLTAFLSSLPRGVPFGVEVRTPELLGAAYAEALRAGGATHCFTVHPSMPSVHEQAAQLGASAWQHGPVAVRWMLRPDQQYEAAREAYAPFDQLSAPDLSSRAEVAALVAELAATQPRVIVIANNKAEGSAPLTLRELARLVASRGTR